MKAIIGLGNPGEELKDTRHNIGFWVIDDISRETNIHLKYNKKLSAIIGKDKINNVDTILVKPTTFMNYSGVCVKKVKDYFNIECKDLIVIYDDVDIPLGRIKIKSKGGSGGHKGVKSIIDSIKTNSFARIKIGIGKLKTIDTADYVLSKPKKSELKILEESIKKTRQICLWWLNKGINSCMNKFNP